MVQSAPADDLWQIVRTESITFERIARLARFARRTEHEPMNILCVEDPVARLNVYYDLTIVLGSYLPGSVECLLDAEATVMTPDNVEHLYTAFTPTTVNYQRGSRPFFEEILAGLLTDDMSDWQRYETILRWVMTRENWPARDGSLPDAHFGGGTEEVIVGKGGGQCTETARLLGTILAVAGIPSRLIGHWNATFCDLENRIGHMTNEVYLNSSWAYVDATRGLMVPKNDNGWASAWELRTHPELISACSDVVLRGFPRKHDTNHYRTFLANNFAADSTLLTVVNYLIDQRDRYSYDYFVPSPDVVRYFQEQKQAVFDRLRRRIESIPTAEQRAAQQEGTRKE